MRALLLSLLALAAPAAARNCPAGWGADYARRCVDRGGGPQAVLSCLGLGERGCLDDVRYYRDRMLAAASTGKDAAKAYVGEARGAAESLRVIEDAERQWGGRPDYARDHRLRLESLIVLYDVGRGADPAPRDDDVTALPPAARATTAPFRPRRKGPEDDSAPGLPLRAAVAIGAAFVLLALGAAWWNQEGPDGEGLPEYGRPPLPGQLIAGRWKLRERLPGPGVPRYRAWDDAAGKAVILRGPIPVPVPEMHRAVEEAASAAKITHPALRDDYAAAKDIRGIFVAVEDLSGQTLEDALARGALDPEFTRRLAARSADALSRLHEEARVHGGFGPPWLLLREDGSLKLRGLGPCPDPSPDGFREPGERRPDAATDQFSWAATVYAMLTGRAPFGGADGEELLSKPGGCPSPARHRAGLPPSLDAFFRKATHPDPAQRYADVKEAAKAFEQCWTPQTDAKTA